MKQFEINFSDHEWKEQMNKTVKSGKSGTRLRFSSLFDYISYSLNIADVFIEVGSKLMNLFHYLFF